MTDTRTTEAWKPGDTFKFKSYAVDPGRYYSDWGYVIDKHKEEIAVVTDVYAARIEFRWPNGTEYNNLWILGGANEDRNELEDIYKVDVITSTPVSTMGEVGDPLTSNTALKKEKKTKMPRRKKLKVGDVVKLDNYDLYEYPQHRDETAIVKLVGEDDIKVEWPGGESSYLFKRENFAGAHLAEQPKPKKPTTSLPAAPVGDLFAQLLAGVDQSVSQRIHEQVGDKIDELSNRAQEALDNINKTRKLEIVANGKSNVIAGLQHERFKYLLQVVQLRQNALLVGMAGTGKTHAGSQVAEALDLPFYTMSVGAQTSKSDIIGYMNATGGYVGTHFREAYEKGGIFLMDEIDAGNANVLIQVNAALSNGLLAFPDAMVTRHPDFVFIASANTYGTGMNRQYVGRNQLDAATLDRFTILNWDVDAELERSLSNGNDAWYQAILAARQYVTDHDIKALITPRATQKGSALLANGVHVEEVIKSVVLASVPEDKQVDLTRLTMNTYCDKIEI